MGRRLSGSRCAGAERLYRLLLCAYPRAFRREYAAEMLASYRDAYCQAAKI